jgi:uncharacterized protein (UPF0333 family)
MPKMADEITQTKKTTTRSKTSIRSRSNLASGNKTTTRKAPLRESSLSGDGATRDNYRLKFSLSLLVVTVFIGGASYVIGNSDGGQINVSSAISERVSEDIKSGGSAETEVLQALNQNQNRKPVPNGGLVGRGNRVTEQQKNAAKVSAQETASSTATSTEDSTASTSEAILDDEEASIGSSASDEGQEESAE